MYVYNMILMSKLNVSDGDVLLKTGILNYSHIQLDK